MSRLACLTNSLIGALAFVSVTGIAATSDTSLDAQIAPIFTYWDRPDSPGAAVAVARNGKMLYTGGFGLANLEFGVPVTPETAFHAGSIAKQFTATAVLMLEAEGRLALDDRIRRYIPELPRIANRITLRQLLNHTSGLRDIWALTDLAGWLPADARTRRQAMRLLNAQEALNFEPGTSFGYSNSGYMLLAEVVARVGGQSFPAWTREHLFIPAGMTATYFYDDHTRVLPGSADSYRSLGRDRGFAKDSLNSDLAGGGNIVTTVADLVRWAEYLRTARLGEQTLLARLSEQEALAGGMRTGYGMGLFVGGYRGLPVVHHGGASAGYRSHLLTFVDAQVSIVVLGNVNTVRANALAREIADVVLNDRFTVAPPGAGAKDVELLFPLEAYTGLYAMGPTLLLDVREVGGRLVFLLGGATPREMFPAGPHIFATSEAGASLRFIPDSNRSIDAVELQVPGRARAGQRLAPFELTAAAARAYLGEYFSQELGTSYTIVRNGDGLAAQRFRGDDIALLPIDRDRFIESTMRDLTLRFDRRASGRVRGFELSVDRARGIWFEKQ